MNTDQAAAVEILRSDRPAHEVDRLETAMSGDQITDQPLTSLGGAMLVGAAALLVLGVQPVLLGALVDEGRLSAVALGQLAMLEVITLAAGCALGPYIMMGRHIRAKTALVCIALAAVCFGVYATHSLTALYGLRAVAGLLEGLAVGATVAIVAHTRNPDRVTGVFLAAWTIPQMLMAYVLPVAITPRWGANAGFAVLGIFALVAAIGAAGLISPERPVETHHRSGRWRSPAVLIALAGIVAQNAGIGGAWNYVHQLGGQHHFTAETVGLALSASLGFSVVGVFLVSWLGWRVSYRLSLLIGLTLQTAIVLALTGTDQSLAYSLEVCMFGLLWMAMQPFQIRQLITLDPTRRAVLLVTPLVLVGLSLGPLLASFVVRQGDVTNAFWVAAGLFCLSSALLQMASWRKPEETA